MIKPSNKQLSRKPQTHVGLASSEYGLAAYMPVAWIGENGVTVTARHVLTVSDEQFKEMLPDYGFQ